MDTLIEYEQSVKSNVGKDSVANKLTPERIDWITTDQDKRLFLLSQLLATEMTEIDGANEKIDAIREDIYENKEVGGPFITEKQRENL